MNSSVKDFLVRSISLSGAVAFACVALTANAIEAGLARQAGFSTFKSAPLCFETNSGQSDGSAQFIARGVQCSVLLAPTAAEIVLAQSSDNLLTFNERTTHSVRLELVGANPVAKMAGRDQMAATANYFIGNDPAGWHAGVPLFSRVRVDEVYPGVQVIYYANQSAQLEYDFLLQAGVAPEQIRFRVTGTDTIQVDAAGNLVLKIGGDEIRQHQPVAYQESGGVRKEIQARYQVNADGTVGFALVGYDRSLPLVIDPSLDFLTYLGGSKLDIGWCIALGTNGNIYVAGETLSTGIVTTNEIIFTNPPAPTVYYTNFQGGTHQYGDAFVACYDNNGVVQYLTYLGGKGDDGALGIAVDGSGGAWVTGFTDSTNFPLVHPFLSNGQTRTNLTGRNTNAKHLFPVDAFITHLDSTGSNIVYSSYFGGNGVDEGVGICLPDTNDLYITGLTTSSNLPFMPTGAIHAFQTNWVGDFDAFVTKFVFDTSSETFTNYYTTYLGGSNLDYGLSIAVDSKSDAWITGVTYSTNFWTANIGTLSNYFNVLGPTNAFPPHRFAELNNQTNSTRHNTSFNSDAFVTEFDPTGTNVLFSTLLGGTNNDSGMHITIDSSDNVYVVGTTFARDFPTNTITFQTSTNVTNSAPPGSGIVFTNITTNFISHVFVTELVVSPTNANAYVIGSSTQFGGTGVDQGTGIAVDNNGLVYVTGSTSSTNFFQTNMLVFTNTSLVPDKHNPDITNTVYLGTMTNNPVFTNLSSTNVLVKLGHGANSRDIFVAVLAPGLSNLDNGIMLGGQGADEANGIAVDPSGNAVYIVGDTTSVTNFTTTNATQRGFGGKKSPAFPDAFIGKIILSP